MFYKLNEKLIFFFKKTPKFMLLPGGLVKSNFKCFSTSVQNCHWTISHGGKEASYGSAGYSHNQQMASTVSSLPLGQQ